MSSQSPTNLPIVEFSVKRYMNTNKVTIKGLYKFGAPLKSSLIVCLVVERVVEMLAIFSGSVVKAPEELIQAGNRSPTPKESSAKLVDAFDRRFPSSVNVNIGSLAHILYSHDAQNSLQPR